MHHKTSTCGGCSSYLILVVEVLVWLLPLQLQDPAQPVHLDCYNCSRDLPCISISMCKNSVALDSSDMNGTVKLPSECIN